MARAAVFAGMVVAVGCGRLGFDARTTEADSFHDLDGSVGEDADLMVDVADASVTVDAAVPAGCAAMSFGEMPYAYCPTALGWDAAQATCASVGLSLITIADDATNTWYFDTLAAAGGGYGWIGLHDRTTEGTFVWVSGSPSAFRRFATGEPNDFGGNEDCVTGPYLGPYAWNDTRCADAKPFMCGP